MLNCRPSCINALPVLMGRCADYFWRCWLVTANVCDTFFDVFCLIVTSPMHLCPSCYLLGSFLWLGPSGVQLSTDTTQLQASLSKRILYLTETIFYLYIVETQMSYKLHTLKMSSGLLAATSSMSIPPCGLPTMTGPLQDRSIRMAK